MFAFKFSRRRRRLAWRTLVCIVVGHDLADFKEIDSRPGERIVLMAGRCRRCGFHIPPRLLERDR